MPDGPHEGYLLDTNIASPAWDQGDRHHSGVVERLEKLGLDLVFVSVISLAEVEYGLGVSPSIEPARHEQVRRAMNAYELFDVDRHTATVYGRIRANLFKIYAPRTRRGRIAAKYVEDLLEPTTGKELGIQENDLWIVSVAVQYNLVFVTHDQGGGMKRIVQAADYSARTQFWNFPTV